jgi:hypothetical protein
MANKDKNEIGWFSSLSFTLPVGELHALLNKTGIVHMTGDRQM